MKITLRLPREQNNIRYIGNADKFLNKPIVIENQAIGTIIEIINETDEYIEVEGVLFHAGVNFSYPYSNEIDYEPAEIEVWRYHR